MDSNLIELQKLLLDLLGDGRQPDAGQIAALQPQQWDNLLSMVRTHRLGPMLHWRLKQMEPQPTLPEPIKTGLTQNYHNGALRSLMLQRELVKLHNILTAADIPYAALKGAYLAFHAYPNPVIRPMRDLDILVPRATALEAFQLLIDNGYRRPRQYRGNPQASLDTDKHFPPIRTPSGQINIELHFRLTHPSADRLVNADPAGDPELWQRRIQAPIADTAISYLSPTDLLLHLMIHAAYDHRFSNGPQLMADLAYLLESHGIDWPLLWEMAKQGGWLRGSLLTLKMTERYYKQVNIEFPGNSGEAEISMELINSAGLLSLSDIDSHRGRDTQINSELGEATTLGQRVTVFLKRIFPPKQVIASRYPADKASPLIYLYYLALWWRLLRERLPEYLSRRQDDDLNQEARMLARIDQWLKTK